MNRPVISLRDVDVCYKQIQGFFKRSTYYALKNVSFDLYNGETLGVVGRNGAGKSTLLKILANIILPDSGELLNHGSSVSLLTIQSGFVPNLSGRQNAILNGLLLGMSQDDIAKKIEDIKEFSGIGDFFEQPVRCYSTGMSARLGFSVVLNIDPDVVLIDELLGVGDETFKKKSVEIMKERIRSEKTYVLVSHNIALHHELCDRVVWIEHGEVQMLDETNKVLHNYIQYLKAQS